MAGLILNSKENNEYYVKMEATINSKGQDAIKVSVHPMLGECRCGSPIKSKTYAYTEQEKATKLFNKYVKEFLG